MKIRINEAKGKLKLGDWVRTNSKCFDSLLNPPIEGEVGEITEYVFYIWQNTNDGCRGQFDPSNKGYKYSWEVMWEQKDEAKDAYVEILKRSNKETNPKITMQKLIKESDVFSTLKRIDDKINLLYKILDPILQPVLPQDGEESETKLASELRRIEGRLTNLLDNINL